MNDLPGDDHWLEADFEEVYRIGSLAGEDWEQFGTYTEWRLTERGDSGRSPQDREFTPGLHWGRPAGRVRGILGFVGLRHQDCRVRGRCIAHSRTSPSPGTGDGSLDQRREGTVA